MTTRSKIGQVPRFLLVISYKQGNFQISDLDRQIKLESEMDDLAIRSVNDYTINLDNLLGKLKKHKNRIEELNLVVDDDIRFTANQAVYVGAEIVDAFKQLGVSVNIQDYY